MTGFSFTGLQRAPFIPTLTEFYFENVVPTDSAYARIGRLRNLKKLSIRFWYDEADEKILHLKVLVPIVELQTSQKVLEELNEKRPKLVITNRRNYFINGVIQDGKAYINKEFLGDINAVLNDFSEIDGFCCMGSVCSEYVRQWN
uniref:Doublecortin domain-containing protein n=1 Tax=Ascaris lumbricoides TaxID=6252 RepID=A0A0M3IPI2_ASCLU